MKYLILILVVFIAGCGVQPKPVGLVSGAETESTPTVQPNKKEVIKNSYIVEVKADLPANFLNQVGAKIKKRFTNVINAYQLEMTPEQATRLAKHPNVISVEEEVVVTPTEVQENATWGLDRINQRELPLDTQFSYVGTGSNVTAYIIDSGINYTHTDFGGRASNAYDIINDGTKDCSGHGTHIAGTIGGTTYGIAKAVTLKGIKVACGSVGVGNYIAGLDWIAANNTGLAVANISATSTIISKSWENAVNSLVRKNVTVVVSSGNNSMDACATSPSHSTSAISVGAMGGSTSGTDIWWVGSNYGSCVDMVAPGIAITSVGNSDDTGTAVKGGTSMAAPHVAGVAVLARQANPSVAGKDIINLLVANATNNVITGVPAGTPNRLVYNNW